MDPNSLPALSRDAFVANVLWFGVCLLCQGSLGIDLNVRGNLLRGEAFCANGLGDELLVVWDEHGVVALVHDDDGAPLRELAPQPPEALRVLTERALSGSVRATGWLWICGDRASPRLPPAPPDSLLNLIDTFCGPPQVSNDVDYALERELFEAIAAGQAELPAALAEKLLDSPLLAQPVNELGKTRLEAARATATGLSGFGLVWSTVERDVAQRA